ncbi:15494_t:CDS:2, partial [Funneliformis geosporum]
KSSSNYTKTKKILYFDSTNKIPILNNEIEVDINEFEEFQVSDYSDEGNRSNNKKEENDKKITIINKNIYSTEELKAKWVLFDLFTTNLEASLFVIDDSIEI